MKKNVLLIILVMSTHVWAAGNTGLAVLKIGIGARAAGMGEAFVASSNEASGMFWNPAGPAWMTSREAHFTHTEWLQGINHEVAAISFPSGDNSFGLGILLNNIEGFEHREIASEEPLGTFSSQDFSLMLNYARTLSERLSLGINAKYISEKIYIEHANGYMIDLGARYRLHPRLFTAMSFQNVGITTKMDEEKINIPKVLRLGAAYQLPFVFLQDKLHLVGDYMTDFDSNPHVNLGLEGQPFDVLTLRVGYQTGYEEKNISAGFGLTIGHFGVDYAYVPFRDLGQSHRFSLSTRF